MNLFTFLESYKGPKLSLLFTGCGAHAAELLLVPGASKVLYDLQIPYSHEAVEVLTGPLAVPSVSKERVLALHARYRPEDVLRVTVTAAITSARYRQGENHAYIAIDSANTGSRVWHLTLRKVEEKYHKSSGQHSVAAMARNIDDYMICEIALTLVLGQEFDWLEGSLVEV